MDKVIAGEHQPVNSMNTRKHAEAVGDILGALSPQWTSTFDAVSDSICILDTQWTVLHANKATAEIFQTPIENLIGRKCYEIIHGTREPIANCPVRNIQQTGQRGVEELYLGKKWIQVTADPLFDDRGVFKGVVHIVSDISDRKQAEEALRESHATFLTVLDSIDATIYAADLETHEILFMNKHMIDLFGKDMTGEKCYQAFRRSDGPCLNCNRNQLLDRDGNPGDVVVWQGENPITGKWFVNCDRAIRWTDGRLAKIQIATDITQIKAMERQLLQAQKYEAIGTLAGGVAHDFNNLLMGIQGHTSLMVLDLEGGHPHLDHLNAISEYVRSASDLTKQLLGFARGGKYEVKPIDINKVVQESSEMFGRTKKEINIHTKLGSAIGAVEADRRQIEQVLINLYVNAWQAMPDGGDLFLETKRVIVDSSYCQPHNIQPGRYVKISVTDTGIGMDETTRHRVFDPFFTTKEKGRGTGMGLASAYGIIKNHDGAITVYSEVGQGSTFTIYLPESLKTACPDFSMQAEVVKGSGTILLIDDEKMILKVGHDMLEKLGYGVVLAKSGLEALEILECQDRKIDLVILDLIMPGMDGSRTFDGIRKIDPAIPIILSSGYTINTQAERLMHEGCNAFLQKPFSISELSKTVHKVLDAAKN